MFIKDGILTTIRLTTWTVQATAQVMKIVRRDIPFPWDFLDEFAVKPTNHRTHEPSPESEIDEEPVFQTRKSLRSRQSKLRFPDKELKTRKRKCEDSSDPETMEYQRDRPMTTKRHFVSDHIPGPSECM